MSFRPTARSRALGAVACLALILSACSRGEGVETTPMVEAVKVAKQIVKARRGGGGATGAGGAPVLNREELDKSTEPLIYAQIDKIGGAAVMRRARSNQGYVTWASPDLLTLTLRDGVLSETRGLVGDLLSAEVAPLLAAFQAGGSEGYTRALRYIGGDREILLTRMNCTLEDVGAESIEIVGKSFATEHFAEICRDPRGGGAVRNDYWRGKDGTMWQSRQFIHPATGYVTIQVLVK